MEFSSSKFKVLTVTNKVKPVCHRHKMQGIYSENVVLKKYLRVILHIKISWKSHISNVVAKGNSNRQFFQGSLSTCFRNVKLKSYKTYVRPIVEYASSIWGPSSKDL